MHAVFSSLLCAADENLLQTMTASVVAADSAVLHRIQSSWGTGGTPKRRQAAVSCGAVPAAGTHPYIELCIHCSGPFPQHATHQCLPFAPHPSLASQGPGRHSSAARGTAPRCPHVGAGVAASRCNAALALQRVPQGLMAAEGPANRHGKEDANRLRMLRDGPPQQLPNVVDNTKTSALLLPEGAGLC